MKNNILTCFGFLVMTFLCNNTILAKKNDLVQPTDRIINVIWNSPSENASSSMPLGNGDIPDIDHGSVFQNALNLMLLQCEGNEIRILPCWPKDWNVDFKLHAPQQTVVEASVRDGKIVFLNVKPQSRFKDVIFKPIFGN